MSYEHLLDRVQKIVEGEETATMQQKLDLLLSLNLDSLRMSSENGRRLTTLEQSFVFSSWFKRAIAISVSVFGLLACWGIVVNWDRTGELLMAWLK